MLVPTILGFILISLANFFSAKFGISSNKHGDKDILFPFSTMLFLFFSLLIYLPQVNNKFIKIQQQVPIQQNSKKIDEDELFPLAFLYVLLSVSLAILVDKFMLNKPQQQKSDDQNKLYDDNNARSQQQSSTLKYFLTLSIAFVNISDAYFLTKNNHNNSLVAELFVLAVFSIVINFSYGYLLGWVEIQQSLINKFLIFTNAGLITGFLFGLFLKAAMVVLVLPCISVALSLYTAAFICMPKIFTNGQKPVQDKFRYWSIFTALLMTILYYPIIYLLKI